VVRILIAAMAVGAAAGGCLDQTYLFVCHSADECTAGARAGVCEASGHCSFADNQCPSGRRYGAFAGAVANKCTACGNGVVEDGEECDDGNSATDDDCLPTCRFNVCGDGFVRKAVEECDDGNLTDGDQCNHNCLRCSGGDGHFSWPDNGHCYLRVDAPQTWNGAQQACTELDGYLVTYNSEVEQTTVRPALLTMIPGPHWIGLRDQTGTAYTWLTGEPVVMPMADFVSALPAGQCATNTGATGAWAAAACTTQAGFLCENPGWIIDPKHNHAYKAFFEQPSWAAAVQACTQLGAHLVSIGDREEQDFVSAQFFGTFWLGGQRTGTAPGDSWTWVTGEPFVFQTFADGEPDDTFRPTCLALGSDRRWHDRICDGSLRGPYGYICEVD
jgi:cysteine-rich repeat protein